MITLEAGRTSTWRLPRFSALKMLRRQSLSTETRTMAPARGGRAKRAQHVAWKTHSRSGQQAIPRADAPQRAAAEGAGHLASCTCKSWFTEACENLVPQNCVTVIVLWSIAFWRRQVRRERVEGEEGEVVVVTLLGR